MKTAIGLDLGGTFIKAGLVTDEGTVRARVELPTRAEDNDRDVVLDQMRTAVDRLREHAPPSGLAGIGIGTPGVVDSRGVVYESPNLPDWDNLPLRDIFSSEYRVPVVVENDVNSIAWGEFLFGAGRGSRSMVCLTLGTGIGGGVVSNGRLLRGAEFSAIEIGHTTIDYRGPRCKCGNIGCIEAFAGKDAIVARATAAISQGRKTILSDLCGGDTSRMTPKMLYEAAGRGDAVAREVWEDVGVCLGALCTTLVNLFNPEKIVIGGGISGAGDFLFQPIRRTVAERAFRNMSAMVSIVPAGLGTDTGIISGAALVFQQ